jgi:2-oxoisovalerate dehydrogenase E2 component (dihydrolipoyl transacylase)
MTNDASAVDEQVFRLPDLGEGLQEAEIVQWLVGVGDHVVADQPLVTIDSEKAVLDVPSPRSGRIAAIHGEAGDRVAVGAILVEFADEREGHTGGGAALVGRLPEEEAPAAAVAPPAVAATAAPSEAAPAQAAPRTAPTTPMPGARPLASPSVRQRARELGVELTSVVPTGERGEVTHADLDRAAARPERPAPAPEPRIAGAEPLRGVRLAMAQAMAEAHRQVAPATVMDEADVEAWQEHEDVTARLIRALVAGAAASPALNAWYDASALAVLRHEAVRVGVAVETDDGLFVVVLEDARERSAAHIRHELDELEAAVRARSVAPERLRGSTVALSNFGMLAGRFAELTLPPPQVAILGAGRVAERVVAHDDGIAVHRMLPLSLTFDHRAATGMEAAAFLQAVMEDLSRAE